MPAPQLLLSVVEVNGQEVMDLLAPGAEPTRGAKIRIEDGSNDWWLDRSKVVERSITSGGVERNICLYEFFLF